MRPARNQAKINIKLIVSLVVIAGGLVGGAFLARELRRQIISRQELAAGSEAYEAERWNDVCKHFAEYLSRNPKDVDILLKYAEAHLRADPFGVENLAAAIDAYRRVLRVQPEREATYEELSRMYRYSGDSAELAYIADRLLERKPGDLRALLWKAQALEVQGRPEEVLSVFGADETKSGDRPEYLKAVEEQGGMENEYIDACLLLARLTRARSSSGASAQEQGADPFFAWAAAYAPDRAMPLVARAMDSLRRLGEGSVSLDALPATPQEDLIAAGKRSEIRPGTRLALVAAWMQLGDLEKARSHFGAAEAVDAEEIRTEFIDRKDWQLSRFLLGEDLFTRLGETGKCEELIAFASSAFEDSQRHKLAAYPALCELHCSLGQAEEARACLEGYRDLAPGLQYSIPAAQNANIESRICELEGKPYRVIELLEPLRKDGTLDINGLRRLADAYATTRQPARAEKTYARFETRAYGIVSGSASKTVGAGSSQLTDGQRQMLWQLAHNRASQRAAEGDWQGALSALEEATHRLSSMGGVPESSVGQALLAARCRLHRALPLEAEARETELAELSSQLDELRQEYPQRADIRLLQADIALVRDRMQEAEEVLLHAAEECTEASRVKLRLARLYAETDRLAEATAVCRKLCEKDPSEDAAWAALSQYAYRSRNQTEAREALERGLEAVDDVGGRRRLSTMLAIHDLLDGEGETAIQRLSQAAEDDGNDLSLRLLMLDLPPVRQDRSRAQALIDEIKAIEGETGLHWRYQQARLWFGAPDWSDRADDIERLLRVCVHEDESQTGPALLLSRALERRGRLEEATQVCRAAFDANPGAVEVADRLITLLRRQDQTAAAAEVVQRLRAGRRAAELRQYVLALDRADTDAALAHLKQLVNDDTQERDASSRVALARLLYLREKDVEAAMAHLDAAEAAAPDWIRITDVRAFILREEGRTDEALELLNDRVERLDDFDSLHLRAAFFNSTGEVDQAEKDYLALAKREGSRGRGYTLLARFYSQHERLDEAVRVLEQARKELPQDAAVARSLLDLYLALGRSEDREKGLALLDQLREREGADVGLDYARARLLLATPGQESAREAERILQDVVAREPTYVAAHLDLIGIASRRSDWEEARQRAIRAAAANQLSRPLQVVRADIEQRLGNAALAASLARGVLEKDAENADALRVLAAAGRLDPATLDEARERTAAAVQRSPAEVPYRLILAGILEQQNRRQEAIECLLELPQDSPGARDVRVLLTLADLYRLDGKTAQVDGLIAQATEIAPDDPMVVQARMRHYAERGQFAELARSLHEYRSGRPEDIATARAGASALLQSPDAAHRELALKVFREVLEKVPDWVDVRYALAYGLHLQGDLGQAVAEYRKVLAGDPGYVPALNDLAWILGTENGEKQEALELANRGVAIDPTDIHLLDTRGVILREVGRFDEAKKDFERLVELTEGRPRPRARALLQLARTCCRLEQRQEALGYLERAQIADGEHAAFSDREKAEITQLLRQCRRDEG